jgi:hypothetical protein
MDLPTFGAVSMAVLIGVIDRGYFSIVAILFVVSLGVRSYRACLRVDDHGVRLKNQYRNYEIPWADIRGLVADAPRGLDQMGDIHGRRLSIDRRTRRNRVIAFVSVGMTSAEQIDAISAIAGCARGAGYEIPAGTRDELRRLYASEALAKTGHGGNTRSADTSWLGRQK